MHKAEEIKNPVSDPDGGVSSQQEDIISLYPYEAMKDLENGASKTYNPMQKNVPVVVHTNANLLIMLMNEVLKESKKEGFDTYTVAGLASTLILSGLSCYIYYQPNIDAGNSLDYVAQDLGLPHTFFPGLLTSNALISNYFLNTYFIWDESLGIRNSILSTSLFNSIVAQINKEGLTREEKARKLFTSVGIALLKTLPVFFSTEPYIALSIDKDDEPTWFKSLLMPSLIFTYGLMHWKAIGHLLEKVVDFSSSLIRSPSQKTMGEVNLENHKKTIETALTQFRFLVQIGKTDILQSVYSKAKFSNASGGLDVLMELLQVLENNAEQFTSLNDIYDVNKAWLKALHIMNISGSVICSLGYFADTYSESSELCGSLFGETALCDKNSPWVFMSAISGIVLFGYLVACVGAPQNTNAIWDLFTKKNQVNSLAYQKNPGIINAVSSLLILSALFSWGTTVALNQQYIPKEYLVAINIISIFYNAYFNAFPIPAVVPVLIHAINKLLNKLMGKVEKESQKNNENIETFLVGYSKKLENIEPAAFQKQFSKFSEEEQKLLAPTVEKRQVLDDLESGRQKGCFKRCTSILFPSSKTLPPELAKSLGSVVANDSSANPLHTQLRGRAERV